MIQGVRRVNLYRMWALGDISYEDVLTALRRQNPHVEDEVFRGWLVLLAPLCPCALLAQSPQLPTTGQAA